MCPGVEGQLCSLIVPTLPSYMFLPGRTLSKFKDDTRLELSPLGYFLG